ncbi:MAG: DUF1080 domain-containing protein [Gemmatimonadota bacterium]
MQKIRIIALLLAVAGSASAQQTNQPINQLTAEEKAGGWRLLFDGKSFAGWRGLGYDTVPTNHWEIDNGTIHVMGRAQVKKGADGRALPGGDLLTLSTFKDFELAFEWKVPPASNSGVKYNVDEKMSMGSPTLSSATVVSHSALGFEYQVLDDSLHSDGKLPIHRAGALYELIPPNADKKLMPVGEWNRSRIVFRGNHGEHWLNGKMVVTYEMATPVFDSLIAKSKYHVIPGFANRRTGPIILQDHNEEAWFRSIRIREIK